MDNPKAAIKKDHRFGLSLIATDDIKAGEIIASFDGDVYFWCGSREEFKALEWRSKPLWSIYRASTCQTEINRYFGDSPNDHMVQFGEHAWRDSTGFARYINHSCDPNCGLHDMFDIVAMYDITVGQELTFDYDMSENSDWTMDCNCGSTICRKKIGRFNDLPINICEKYKGFISEWLIL